MQTDNRPLSPHLQIYKLPLAAVLSILHRATGVALSLGSVLLVYWLIALAGGPESYATAQALFGSVVGQLVLFGLTWAFFHHFCNGIRHLVWDTGRGLTKASVAKSNLIVIGAALVLTVLTWVLVYALGGA